MVAARSKGAQVDVYLEVGTKRFFASAADWPGWCRQGKTEELALEALAAYAPRYAPVAGEAGIAFPGGPPELVVVERLPGSASTEFGVPGTAAEAEGKELSPAERARLASLLLACWEYLDRVVSGAPAELRKGPRGGGRDRDAIFQHVVSSECAYSPKIGVKLKEPAPGDRAAVDEARRRLLDALSSAADPDAGAKRWSAGYFTRRAAWHALDHAWEIEDRVEA
jgi:hypothetical protein